MVNLPGPIEEAFQRAQQTRNPNSPAPAPGADEQMEDVHNADPVQPIQPEEPQAPPEEDWKKRFVGYKQSTDQTIHELRQLVAQRESDRATQQHELEQMRAELDQLRKQVPRNYVPEGVLSEDDIEVLGEENAQRMARLAQAYADKVRQEYESKLAVVARKVTERDQIESQQAEIRSNQDYWVRVQGIVPDAVAIDNDPKFSDFLNTVEPNSGKTWRDLGKHAKSAWDVQRMADIYRAYQKATEPPSREEEVVPRGAGHSNAPTSTLTGQRIWTRREYEKAVQDVIRGGPPTPNKMAEVDKLHAEFMQALRENRVR